MRIFCKRDVGRLRVTHALDGLVVYRDFDNEEWSYQWLKTGDIPILRLNHDLDPDAITSFDYVDFSAPVSVEFTWGQE